MRIKCFFFSALFLSFNTWGALPPEAKAYLEKLPGKAVSLDLVLLRAMQSSDSFRAVAANAAVIQNPLLKAKAPLAFKLYSKATHLDDRREPSNPFIFNRLKSTQFSLGASTYLTTGTLLQAEVMHGSSSLVFNTIPRNDYFETKGSLSLTQNLWKDALGTATRKGIELGEISQEANRLNQTELVENWTYDLVQVFYAAWLAQEQAKASLENIERRKRLVATTRVKVNRGTSETTDLLQVENALLNAEVQREQAVQLLGNRWRELRAAIKLPDTLETIDPIEIPITLDNPTEEAKGACGPRDALKKLPEKTLPSEKAKLQLKAAELNEDRARNLASPSLEFQASLLSNGIDPSNRGATFNETIGYQHPGWSVGLNFTLPLQRFEEEANLRQAVSDRIKSEALSTQTQDMVKLQWTQYCLDFYRLNEARNKYDTAFKNQMRRVQLENNRFNVGRTSTFAVVQAGDDATNTELALLSSEMELRLAAWRVRRLAEGYNPYLKKLSTQVGSQIPSEVLGESLSE